MKKKKHNDLSDEHEYIIRKFIDDVAVHNVPIKDSIIRDLFDRLGYYVLEEGKAVYKGQPLSYTFGDPNPWAKYEDRYGPDGEALLERLNEHEAAPADPALASEPTEGN